MLDANLLTKENMEIADQIGNMLSCLETIEQAKRSLDQEAMNCTSTDRMDINSAQQTAGAALIMKETLSTQNKRIAEAINKIKGTLCFEKQYKDQFAPLLSYSFRQLSLQEKVMENMQKSYVRRLASMGTNGPEPIRWWAESWKLTTSADLERTIELLRQTANMMPVHDAVSEVQTPPVTPVQPELNNGMQQGTDNGNSNSAQYVNRDVVMSFNDHMVFQPTKCPACGIRNPIGRTHCLRCGALLEQNDSENTVLF